MNFKSSRRKSASMRWGVWSGRSVSRPTIGLVGSEPCGVRRGDENRIVAVRKRRSQSELANTRSSWRVGRSVRTSFVGTQLVDAVLTHAVFTECDLRAANLAIVNSTVPDAFVRIEFNGRDLRATNWDGRNLAGARFVDCKMYGVFGLPRRLEGRRSCAPICRQPAMVRSSAPAPR